MLENLDFLGSVLLIFVLGLFAFAITTMKEKIDELNNRVSDLEEQHNAEE